MTVKSRIKELELLDPERIFIVAYLNDWREKSGLITVQTKDKEKEYFKSEAELMAKYGDKKKYNLMTVKYADDWGKHRPKRKKEISEYDRFGALKD